jgi:Flp pilus assembly protein TadD
MYIPLIGLSLALAWGALDLAGASRRGRTLLAGVAATALVALVATSAAQIPHWRDTEALFRRALAVTDDNYVAHHGLASVLLLDSRTEEARVHYEEAARIKPRWPAALLGLGEVLEEEGDLEGAREQYELAVNLAPRNARAREKLGMVLLETHHPNRSVRRLTQALELASESNRPRLHARLARAFIVQGDVEKGLLHYRKAVELDPGLTEAHANLGFALMRAGRPAQAEQSLIRARELGLESPELEAGLGQLAMEDRRWDEAISHLRTARELGSDSTTVDNNLAWLLATNPSPAGREPQEALRIARELVQSADAPHPVLLDTLAAALAAAGRFDEAIEAASRAVSLARSESDGESAASIESRLALYRAGQPYVESPR